MLGKRRTLASQLIEEIKKRILDGDLAPGDKLPSEQSLINQYGVSRTVVREAIAGLRADGMVVTRQGVGAFVTDNPMNKLDIFNPRTLKDILHVLDLRLCLEAKTAELAAQNRSEEQLAKIANSLEEFKKAGMDYNEISAADFQFHMAIAEASGNPYFLKLLEHLGLRSSLIPGLTFINCLMMKWIFLARCISNMKQFTGILKIKIRQWPEAQCLGIWKRV